MSTTTPSAEDELAHMLTQCIQTMADALTALARHRCIGGAARERPATASRPAAPTGAAASGTVDLRSVVSSIDEAVYALNNMLTVVAGHAELGLLARDHEGALSALRAIQQAAAGGVTTVQGLADVIAVLRVVDSSDA